MKIDQTASAYNIHHVATHSTDRPAMKSIIQPVQPPVQQLTDKLTNTLTEQQVQAKLWIGLSRQSCIARCLILQATTIQFAHWLAIPSLGILLSFKNNNCMAVESIRLSTQDQHVE